MGHASSTVAVERDRHHGGEHAFTPGVLTLSMTLGASMTLEQVCDGKLWSGRSTPGAINVMPAHQPRTFRHRDTCDFACFTLTSGLPCNVRPRAALRDEPLRLLLESLLAATLAGETGHLFQDAMASAIVARLLGQEQDDARGHRLQAKRLANVLEFVDAHLDQDLTVDELAHVAGLSPAHFSMLFRNAVGESPYQHVVRLRVERARRLLEQGTAASAAARAVGFFDQSHLTRHMRRLLGITPGALARTAHRRRPT